MNEVVGYVLVTHVHQHCYKQCPSCKGRKDEGGYDTYCAQPPYPRCHAACLPNPRLRELHPECQEFQRLQAAWRDLHEHEVPTGTTTMRHVHFFKDCETLSRRRGARRPDSKIVGLNFETIELLELPVCERCLAKMAEYEKQFEPAAAGMPEWMRRTNERSKRLAHGLP